MSEQAGCLSDFGAGFGPKGLGNLAQGKSSSSSLTAINQLLLSQDRVQIRKEPAILIHGTDTDAYPLR
jgi:hypothetical protein